VGEHITVDAAQGLPVLAARCDTASSALCAPTPAAGGPLDQATTVAVSEIHQLVGSALAAFAGRASDTASATRAAATSYIGTDGDAGNNIAAIGQTIGG